MVGELFLALVPFVRERRLGEVFIAPTDVILDFDRAIVVQPDLVFVSNERSHIATDRLPWSTRPRRRGAVASCAHRPGDEQVGWFAPYGVRECWLVSLPQEQIAVLALDARGVVRRTLQAPGEAVASDVLPGFKAPLLYGW